MMEDLISIFDSITLYKMSVAYLFFSAIAIFGALVTYFYLRNIKIQVENIFDREIEQYSRMSKSLSDDLEESLQVFFHNFTIVSGEIYKKLDSTLKKQIKIEEKLDEANDCLEKIETLQNEIVKYKNIVKRKERKR